MLFVAALTAVSASVSGSTCEVFKDTDIDPHTAGLGWAPGGSLQDCCDACSSPAWWAKGCRFFTFSKGRCWLKANNGSVVKSVGKLSGHTTTEAPPPPPPPPPAPWPKRGDSGPWIKVGPIGIGDDIKGSGEAGTLADAVSPASNPNLIYAGGQNNGASSGVLKSTDMGKHWNVVSKGLWDTRIRALGLVDEAGEHVFVSVPSGVYETTDGAANWVYVNASAKFGSCWTFKNGTIQHQPVIFASCDAGIANYNIKTREWGLIPPGGWGRAGYLTLADAPASSSPKGSDGSSVLGACLGGHVWFGTVINSTAANWTGFKERPCTMLALNPNNADHMLYTKPPMTYQTIDGGKTWESLNHSGIFHCGIDRRGNLYTAAMEGAFISRDCGPGPNMVRPCHFVDTYDNRTQRRTGRSMIRGAHDYQRISMDFAGTVAFPSDQGLFIMPTDGSNELIKANGNLSNNIALKACISKGDGSGREGRYIVTAIWDWAPVASWDNGQHWPSWQTPEDGGSGSCIGEGGGAYGMGASNHMLLMHHHNILASDVGGKNLTRFITPQGGTIFGPAYQSKKGSRHEPDGMVYAPLFMGPMPFEELGDKMITCTGAETVEDVGVQTNSSCLSQLYLGTLYGWYPGVNYAAWRGDTDKHCILCKIPGNSSTWTFTNRPGAWSYVKETKQADREVAAMMAQYDSDNDGRIDEHDLAASMINTEKLPSHHTNADHYSSFPDVGESKSSRVMREFRGNFSDSVKSGATLTYVLRNANYGKGFNWTWTLIPPHMAGLHGFVTSPTSNETLYGLSPSCIARSHDRGETWSPCWNGTGLTGTVGDLVIKNESTMILIRGRGDLPLKTNDGGETWHEMQGCSILKDFSFGMLYSWSGKTLAVVGGGGSMTAEHPHTNIVWTSTDDGETWTDHGGDEQLVSNGIGMAQWYENDLYLNSMGQGIMYKTLEDEVYE